MTENPGIRALSAAQFHTATPWNSVRHDVFTFRFTTDFVSKRRPKVLYLSLGETDDWAHEKRYDRVLEALHQADQYLERLWRWLQEDGQYAGRTTLLITTDHGRGTTPFTWQSHNDRLPGARNTWLAVVNPSLKKRGMGASSEGLFRRDCGECGPVCWLRFLREAS